MERTYILIFLVGLIALTTFIVPDTVSMFVGQHNFYNGIECQRCHASEYDQMVGSVTGNAHIEAANNTNYTTYLAIGGSDYNLSTGTIFSVENKIWTWDGSVWENGSTSILVDFDRNNNAKIDGNEICQLCHNGTTLGNIDIHGMTVRTCDDDWCHGNRVNVLNDPELFNASLNAFNVGMVLNESGNIHEALYQELSNESTGYAAHEPFDHTMGNIAEGSISKGYWACMGCHSDVQVDLEIIPGEFNHTDGVRRRYM